MQTLDCTSKNMESTSLTDFINNQAKLKKDKFNCNKLFADASSYTLNNLRTFAPGDGDSLIYLFVSKILPQKSHYSDTITSVHKFLMKSYKTPSFVSNLCYGVLFQRCSEALESKPKIASRLVYLLTNLLQYRSSGILSLPQPVEEIRRALSRVMVCCTSTINTRSDNQSLIRNSFFFYTTISTRLPNLCPLFWASYISSNSLPCRVITSTLLTGTCSMGSGMDKDTNVDINAENGQHVIKTWARESPVEPSVSKLFVHVSSAENPSDELILAFKTLVAYFRNAEQGLSVAECAEKVRLSYTSYSQMLGLSLLGFSELMEACFREIMMSASPSQEFIAVYNSTFRFFWTAISPSKIRLCTANIINYASQDLGGQKRRLVLAAASSILTGVKRELLRRNYLPAKDNEVLVPIVEEQFPLFITVCRSILSLLDSKTQTDVVSAEYKQDITTHVEYLSAFFGLYPTIGQFVELFPFIPSFKPCFTDDGLNIPLTVLRRLTFHDADGTRIACNSWKDCQIGSDFCSALTVDLLHLLGITSYTASRDSAIHKEFVEDRGMLDAFMGVNRHGKQGKQQGVRTKAQANSVAVVHVQTSAQDALSGASQPYMFMYAVIQHQLKRAQGKVSIAKDVPFSFLNTALDEILGTMVINQALTCGDFVLKSTKNLGKLLQGIELFYLISKLPLYYLEELAVAEMMTIFNLSLQAVNLCIESWPFTNHSTASDASEDKDTCSRLIDLFAHSVSSYCHLLESDIISNELSRDSEELEVDRRAVAIIHNILVHEDYPTKVHCKVVIGIMALLRRHKTAAAAKLIFDDSNLLDLSLKLCQNQGRLQGYMIRVIRFLFVRIDNDSLESNAVLGLPLNTIVDCALDGLLSRDRICFNSISSLDILFTRLAEIDWADCSGAARFNKQSLISTIVTHLQRSEFRERVTPDNGGIIIQLLSMLLSLFALECTTIEATNEESLNLVLDMSEALSRIIVQLKQYQIEARRLLRKLVISAATKYLVDQSTINGVRQNDAIAKALTAHSTLLLEYLSADKATLSYHLHDTQKRVERLKGGTSLEHSCVHDSQGNQVNQEEVVSNAGAVGSAGNTRSGNGTGPEELSTCSMVSDVEREGAQAALSKVRARYDKCSAIITNLYDLLGVAEGPVLEK